MTVWPERAKVTTRKSCSWLMRCSVCPSCSAGRRAAGDGPLLGAGIPPMLLSRLPGGGDRLQCVAAVHRAAPQLSRENRDGDTTDVRGDADGYLRRDLVAAEDIGDRDIHEAAGDHRSGRSCRRRHHEWGGECGRNEGAFHQTIHDVCLLLVA